MENLTGSTSKFGVGCVMLWACFSSKGPGEHDTMNQEVLELKVALQWIFQQNNDSKRSLD